MRLLTHNVLSHNSNQGKGFPLKIRSEQVRVDNTQAIMDADQQVAFVKGFLPTLNWPALVQGATELGIPTLPAVLTEELAQDRDFLVALYHILMNVHLVEGTLTCPLTGREFVVTKEIPNMMLEEEECERVRY